MPSYLNTQRTLPPNYISTPTSPNTSNTQTQTEAPSSETNTTFTMADHTYKFNVTMSCGGCSGAVDRVLKRLEGKHTMRSRQAACSPA